MHLTTDFSITNKTDMETLTQRQEWRTYKGKQVFYSDYSDIKSDDDMISLVKNGFDARFAAPKNEIFLELSDFTGSKVSNKFMEVAKSLGKKSTDEGYQNKSALLGITGLKKTFLSAYIIFSGNKTTKAFNSEEEAVEWLLS